MILYIARHCVPLFSHTRLHLPSSLLRSIRTTGASFRPTYPLLSRRTQTMTATGGTEVLAHVEDHYDGVIVTADLLPRDPAVFQASLAHSLQVWQQGGKRGVWLKVPIEKAVLIALAVQDGHFTFHHAEKGYVMLTRWLHDAESTLPPNASHQVGVGAFVYDRDQDTVLVVQEATGPLRGKGIWKMPTGLVHAGEDINQAAEREVLEETGVRGTFQGVLAVRQAHGLAFGKSDMFFLCAVHPQPNQLDLTIQESEIVAAKWMPFDAYCKLELLKTDLHSKFLERCCAHVQQRCAGMPAARLEAGLWGRQRQDWVCWANDDAPASTVNSGTAMNGVAVEATNARHKVK